jgi:hypothetical protein
MKNILAENLLRFGVKNLSEANKKKLQEQNPPKTATPAAKPAAANKAVTVLTTSTKLSLYSNGNADSVLTFSVAIYKDPKTGKLYANQLSAKDTTKKVNMYFTLDGMGVLKPGDASANLSDSWYKSIQDNFAGYTGPGLTPTDAINNIVAQWTQKTGQKVVLGSDVLKAFEYPFTNRYSLTKTAKVPKGSYIKPGTTYGVRVNLNMDGTVASRTLFIGDYNSAMYGDKTYVNLSDANGTLTPGNTQGQLKYAAKKIANNNLLSNASGDYAQDDILKSIQQLPYRDLISK